MFVDFISVDPPVNKGAQTPKSHKDNTEIEDQDFDGYSEISKDTYGHKSTHTQYTVRNKDIKGLTLKEASRKDKVSLKMIYLLDAKFNNGFLVLSEKNMELG